MSKHMTRMLAVAVAALVGAAPAQAAAKRKAPSPVRDALFVGNNWDGTVDVVDPRAHKRLAHLNAIPDIAERMAEINSDPVKLGYFIAIAQQVGEGHNQYVDDVFSSHDGRRIFISRPSLADVVSIDLATRKIVWRIPVEGNRADHMAISPDGKRLLVSASTARKVHVIDTEAGKLVASFPSGDTPHESNFSEDGKRIFHASIGTVYTPTDEYAFDATKGERIFEIVDAESYKVIKRFDIGKILRTFGFPGMSSAIRPMAIAPGEKVAYFQLSFLHGFVEFDLEHTRPLRIATLPMSQEAMGKRRDEYLLDSAHHGLAIDPRGRKLCAAGTVSDYAAIVDRRTFSYRIASRGSKPYWSTNAPDGKQCVVSYSGDDKIAFISYATGKELATVPVGDHPQRVRAGFYRRTLPVTG